MFLAKPRLQGRIWTELDGAVYGAQADARGLIGGGTGYTQRPPPGEPVHTLDGLLTALERAKPGDTVYIAGHAVIDCTERVYIEKLTLDIPAGVTLAGNRGENGAPGGMILSDAFDTRPLIRCMGENVRITGLRIKGPNPKPCLEHHRRSFAEGRGHEYYYKFPVSDGIFTEYAGLEVDNCELGGWSHAAVFLRSGDRHRIHHNFIHHNQYNGLGYGITHDVATSLIEYNLFNYNRHSIAGTGRPGCGYEARHNVEMGRSLSHCFDMHGGRDRKDGTDIAGTRLHIHHNTFRCPEAAVVIRGVPEEGAQITRNWFYHTAVDKPVRSGGNTRVEDNAYGIKRPVAR